MDAKVARSDRGWEIAVVPVTLTPKGREVFQMDHMARSVLPLELDGGRG